MRCASLLAAAAGLRLAVARDGSIAYRFRRPWRNSKQAVVLDPMTFLSRLAAQVPPARFHMLSYYGVLAPAASRRAEIVPGYQADDDTTCATQQQREVASGRSDKASKPRPRMPWAELVRRVFLEDVLRAPAAAGAGSWPWCSTPRQSGRSCVTSICHTWHRHAFRHGPSR